MTTATPNVQHRYTTGSAGNRLHYLDYGGTGRPLVAMHGVTGNAWNWYAVAAALTDRRHVYAMDFRGYGESQWSAEGAYTTSDHVADLNALLDSIGESSVDLIGSSWGALVAIQYAAENPGRVGQLIVVDVEPSFEQGETDLFPRPTSYADADDVAAGEAQRNPNASPEMVAMMTAATYAPAGDGTLVPKHDPFFFERWPFRSDDHWDRLGKVQAPALLLHATNSFVSGDVMGQMVSRFADARLVEIPDSGHVVPVENPAALSAAVASFLS
ncbi:MAG: alpha/beta hydrolase [Acidimicrobiia bacterium]|nr:alpha/beta hydrolase [Acidimicrobiia bacterium]